MLQKNLPALKRKQERRDRDARRGRLGPGRFDAQVKELVAVIRWAFDAGAIGSLFGLEGPLRHAIRADLCLQGWRWRDADDMAREVMDEALRAVRAIRPTWNEGQPEWTIPANTLIERTRCVRCHKPLPEGHHKFCGVLCASAHGKRLASIREADEARAVLMAIRWT